MPQQKPAYEELEQTVSLLTSQLNQRSQEVAVINSIQESLAKKMEMQAIYDLIGDKIVSIFDRATSILIASFDGETHSEVFRYFIEKGERIYPAGRPLDKLRSSLIALKKKIILRNSSDVLDWFETSATVAGTKVMKSGVFIPFINDDTVVGYISLQNVDEENAFSDTEVQLLETMAHSMSVALQNANLFDETNRLLKETEQGKAELAVINSVQEGLVREIDMEGIYNLVGSRIRDLFNAQVVIIATFDHINQLEYFNYLVEKGQISYPKPRPFDKVRKHLIETGQNILINANAEQAMAEFGMKIVPGTEMPKSLLFMPMKVGDKVAGYVSLQNIDQENAFSFSDVRLLSTLANSMTVALENARLFDKTNRLLKETEQRNAELAVINSVQESLVSQLDMDAIYELVGEKMREIFNPQVIDIATYDPVQNLIEDKYSYEKGDRTKLGPREPSGFRKHVINTGQLLLHNKDVAKAMEEYGNDVLIGEMPKAQVYVPLMGAGKVVGVISLQNLDHENAFSDSDVSLLCTLANSMSVALESARLFDKTTRLLKETEQQKSELSVINSVQEGLAKELDINAIYELVGEKIRAIFQAQVIDISTYDSATNLLQDLYSYEKGDRTLAGAWEPAGFRKHVIENGEVLLINNLKELSEEYGSHVLTGEAPQSCVFVPLISGNDVKGMITLQDLDKENAFTESDVRLLKTVANSMTVALENARLFDKTTRLLKETEQQKGELAVINSVQEGLAKELDIDAIYEMVGEKIREIFKAQVIDIATYDASTNMLDDKYAYEKGDRTLIGSWEPYGFRKHVIETGEVFLINENLAEISKQYDSKVLHGEQPLSCVFVPLISGNEVKGMITLQDLDKEHAFSESDVRLLKTVANSMTVALENARLFDKTNRLLKETEQRNAELAVINSVQDSLVSQLDIDAIYELVGEKMREIFNPQVIDIVTYDPEKNVIEDKYAYEKGDRTKLGQRQPNGFRKHVIKTGQVLLHNSGVAKAMQAFGNEILIGEVPKSQVYVPLMAAGKVMGIISLQNLDHENAFSESDVSLLTTLANSMSVALESARLFDETNRLLKETEHRTAELAVINSVQDGLARELNIKAIYELVGERLRKLFPRTDSIVIRTFDYEREQEIFQYLIEKGERFEMEPLDIFWASRHVIETKSTYYLSKDFKEIAQQNGDPVEAIAGEAPKSAIFVPMVVGDVVKGTVSLQSVERENAFSESDIRLITTVTNSMSVALENARLFDETNRLLKETEQRNAELAVINSVQEALVAQMNMEAIYELVGNRISELFDVQTIGIASLNEETGMEEFKYVLEKGKRYYPDPRPYDNLRKKLIETKQKILISKHSAQVAESYGLSIVKGTEMPKSMLFVPLLVGGEKSISYVSLQNIDREEAFSESDVRLLETLANSMSVALESARLFDETNRLLKETEQRTAELAVINTVQEGLVREMDMQAIYDLVGDKIRELFNAQIVSIALLDSDTGVEYHKYLIENDKRLYPNPRRIDKLRQQLIESKEKLVINDKMEQAYKKYDLKVIPGSGSPKSVVFVPLLTGGKVTHYVSLQNLEKEFAFSPADIRLLETLANSMSVALENARLFDQTNRLLKETEQRTAELAVINSVQEGLAKELDIQGIYDLVGDRIQRLFNAQGVIIASFDSEKQNEFFHYSIENGKKIKVPPRKISGLRKHLITEKHTIYIETEEKAIKEFGLKAIEGTDMPKSLLFVPLLTSSDIRGYVSLQNVDMEMAFSESDVRLLETLANSMSVALENARLFDETNRLLKETEQRTAELAVINSVQDGLAKELDINAIYELVGDRMCKVFPDIHTLVIRTFDHESGLEYFQYAIEKGKRYEIEPRPILWANKQLIANKKTLYINENFVETSKKFGGKGVTTGEPPKSGVFVPMIVGDVVKGSISLQNVDRENAFSESDIRLLNTVTNSMSVALENARLFDETNRLLKETEQRNAELGVINSVQENLVAQISMNGIYELVGEKMRQIFHAQVIDIVTYNKQKNLIEDQYAYEKGDRTRLGLRPPAGFRKHVIETKQILLINEDVAGQREKYGNTVLVGDPAKSLVVVPMIAGGEVTGVITLQNLEKENAFSNSDVSLLTTLTNSMSVALESARLFDETNRLLKETEQRTAELAVINSVQEGLVREMNIKAIYELVGERLCKLFPESQTLVIRTFDYESGTETWEYAIEKGERQFVSPRSFNWNSQVLIQTKKVLDIKTDYLKISKKHGGSGVTAGHAPKSAVFVPMMVGEVVKGSVSLQNVDIENAFSDSDIRLLTTLTNSMSVALENARLFDETNRLLKETEQRTAELAVINSVQEGLVREMDMSAIYETVGDRLCTLFNTQTVVIRTFDHTNGLEYWQYAYEKGVRQHVEPRPFNWNSQLLINTKKVLNVKKNYLEESKKHGGTGVTAGLPPRSAVFVPMVVGDVVKGSVSLQNVDIENAFSDSDVRLLTTLTNSMSVALENARLFDETSRLLSEAKQRASELATVNNISKALAAQLDAQELIEYVGEQMRELFKANIVYLAVLNKKTNTINFPYQYGDVMEPMQLGTGLTSKIITTGEPLLVNKDVQEIRQTMGVTLVGIPAASYLGVPIPVGDEIIGVLSVQSTEQENRFNESDQRLLSTIAASVGVALKNANLFEEVKMAKLEAEAASKAAEKANEAKSAFLSTVSHELRTPLTSVLGFAKIIKKRLEEKVFPSIDQSDPKTKKTINQISDNLNVVVSEGERLTHLINDVLDLAKIEAGKMEWNVEDVSLTEVAERAISATTALFEQKNLRLEKEIEKNLPPISGDRDKLIQVMINLISNAVKFTDKGSVVCKVYKKRKELVVSVTDTGIGIAPEDHAAVFEQFKQVGGDTLTDKPKGTGLGLPICKEIVEHHGGRIWLESRIGKGSTFSFALPLAKTETPLQPMNLQSLLSQLKEQMAKTAVDELGNHSTILIVDDDDSIRSLLHQELSDAGYLIEEARNGRDALDMIRGHKPDLIILDVMMPEMNGFDVAAILKNDPETMDIPIIMLSIVQDKIRGYRIGVDRYLNKPIDTKLLFTEVGLLLEQGKSKKKVLVVDEDSTALRTLTDVLETKGYHVVESNGKELLEKAVLNQPDIIILNSADQGQDEVIKTLRFEKGMENVLFLMYQ